MLHVIVEQQGRRGDIGKIPRKRNKIDRIQAK